MEYLFLMFLDHTQRRTTVGRTPLDEWSARRRDLYLTTRHSQRTLQWALVLTLRLLPAAAHLLRSWVRIPPGGMDICLLWVSCCQVEVSATSWSLVQRSPTDCAASLCVYLETSRMGAPYIYDISRLRVNILKVLEIQRECDVKILPTFHLMD